MRNRKKLTRAVFARTFTRKLDKLGVKPKTSRLRWKLGDNTSIKQVQILSWARLCAPPGVETNDSASCEWGVDWPRIRALDSLKPGAPPLADGSRGRLEDSANATDEKRPQREASPSAGHGSPPPSWFPAFSRFRLVAVVPVVAGLGLLGAALLVENPVTQQINRFATLLAAEWGHAEGQFRLGELYLAGSLGEQEKYKALWWFLQAARQGHANAQVHLGRIYFDDIVVVKDWVEAAHWFRMAAAQGHPDGQYNLGNLYLWGSAVERDNSAAVLWFRMAAVQGHPDAQFQLGMMHQNGQGTEQDDAAAESWWQMAAVQGHADAQYQLAELYWVGARGVERDGTKALNLFRQAVAQDQLEALRFLGTLLAFGIGVELDYPEGNRLLLRAAEQGDITSRILLAPSFAAGRTDLNHVTTRAMRWCRNVQNWTFAQDNVSAWSDFQLLSQCRAQNAEMARQRYVELAVSSDIR